MAIPHAKPIEPVSIHLLGEQLRSAQTTTLVKTDALEVIRLILPGGKEIDEHKVRGEITLQCLEGKVQFRSAESECELTAGQLIYVPASE
jgi:quercetin dioxygenase-like cupin family protein